MRCDIVSFDYSGYGCSSGKPEIYTIILDGEDIINFIIKEFNSKIENIIIFGKGIGAMPAIYLASRRANSNCKALILCMPLILKDIIDIGVIRSIFCPTLLIQEFEDKNQISGDEVINICREIPNEKEWLPIRKRNKENKKNLLFTDPNSENDDYEDVYSRHRCKFIIKIRDCIYPNQELLAKKKSKSSTGGSTDSDSNTFLNNINPETDHPMSMNKVIRNKKLLNLNFDDCNQEMKNQNIFNIKDNLYSKKDLFDKSQIEINNDEDY
jgi:hypothetical protein